jgi:hypothetical protein
MNKSRKYIENITEREKERKRDCKTEWELPALLHLCSSKRCPALNFMFFIYCGDAFCLHLDDYERNAMYDS